MGLDRMAQRYRPVDAVRVAPAHLGAFDDAGLFEALDDANLRKLEVWLRNVRGQAPVSPSHISHNPSVRLEAGDVEDEVSKRDGIRRFWHYLAAGFN